MIRNYFAPALLALMLAFAPRVNAQEGTFPAAPPPDLIVAPTKPPVVLRQTLPNGLRVVIQENRLVPAVYMDMGIRAGTITDSTLIPGLSELVVELIKYGTNKYDEEKRDKAVNDIGGALGISHDRDYVEVSAHCPAANYNKMVELMSDMLLHPKFGNELIDFLAKQNEREMKRAGIPPSDPAGKKHYAYTEHSPTLEGIRRLTFDRVVEYMDSYYRPNNSVLVIVGDINAADALRQIKVSFGGWASAAIPPLPKFDDEPIAPWYRIFLQDDPKAVESKITMFINLPHLEEKDKLALQLASVIMGESLDSRLFRTIREKYGYVYGIQSGVSFSQFAAQFAVQTQCRTAVTARCIKQIQIEVARLGNETTDEEELSEAKNYLARRYDLALQTQPGTMEQLFDIEFYKRPPDYYRQLRKQISALTAADVTRVAKKYMFPDGSATIIVSGPKEKIVDKIIDAKIGYVLNPE